jgi:hypothetical protein
MSESAAARGLAGPILVEVRHERAPRWRPSSIGSRQIATGCAGDRRAHHPADHPEPGGSVCDPTDAVVRLLFDVPAMVAHCESDLIRLRTREGMKIAQAKGRLRGKQPKLNRRPETHLVSLVHSGEYSTAERPSCSALAARRSTGPSNVSGLPQRWDSRRPDRHADVPGRRLFRKRRPPGHRRPDALGLGMGVMHGSSTEIGPSRRTPSRRSARRRPGPVRAVGRQSPDAAPAPHWSGGFRS